MRNSRHALLVTGLFLLLFPACSHINSQPARQENGASGTVRVERLSFRRTLRLHGVVEAVQSHSVAAPRLSGQTAGSMVITKLVRSGTRVRRDDVLVEFDRQNQLKSVLEREAEYSDLVEQIKKKKAEQSAARAHDDTELKGAEYDLQAARVDMRKNDVVTAIEAEKNRQNLAEAEATLAQLRETYKLKRDAAAAELRILEIRRDRAQSAMNYARRNIERMTIRSPLDGLAVLTPIWKMSKMADPQEGDEVRPGSTLLLVVDPAAMQVRARVNQVDLYQLRLGQSAEIRLDAYPDLIFPGTIERLGAIGTPSDYSKQMRNFTAVVAIKGKDPKLLPDLSAAVDVVLETLDHVLVLPRECVAMQGGQSVVEILHEGTTELRPVKVGSVNECELVIASGIDEGAVVSRTPRLTNEVAERRRQQ
jgi:multidrug resistance efflux pump